MWKQFMRKSILKYQNKFYNVQSLYLVTPNIIRRYKFSTMPSNFQSDRTSIKMELKNIQDSLENCIKCFRMNNINITRIESRYATKSNQFIVFIDINQQINNDSRKKLIDNILKFAESVQIREAKEVPWFPITIQEVDSLALLVLEGGADLVEDHPGFKDPIYRKRRKEIADAASRFKYGDKPEYIQYTQQEVECWKTIWTRLYPLLQKHACQQYLDIFNEFQKHCGYKENNIPQLRDVTNFIYDRTGFRLRPTAGLISSRHFLNGLAFKIFFCTQYLRHHSVPFYTPEPDVVHELVGHAPMFANPEFAQFSQEIGIASIGATDEQIEQLARCYWFSIEFGLCRKDVNSNERKIYGAGILSSFGEIEYSLSNQPEIRPWNPFEAAHQKYPITKYQPIYYMANSFEDAKVKMQEFAASLEKPFSCQWDEKEEKLIIDRNIVRQPFHFSK